jgi:hypothetical protein
MVTSSSKESSRPFCPVLAGISKPNAMMEFLTRGSQQAPDSLGDSVPEMLKRK